MGNYNTFNPHIIISCLCLYKQFILVVFDFFMRSNENAPLHIHSVCIAVAETIYKRDMDNCMFIFYVAVVR